MSMWQIETVVMCGLRFAFVVLAACTCTAVGWCYAVAESVAILQALANERELVKRDERRRGVLLPWLYAAAGCMVAVRGSAPVVLGTWVEVWTMLVYAALVMTRLRMWSAFTVARASWVGLVDGGLFRAVRHPLYALDVLAHWSMALAWPCWWNAISATLFTVFMVAAVVVEEGFLATVPAWREYAHRVRWRLVPGLW